VSQIKKNADGSITIPADHVVEWFDKGQDKKYMLPASDMSDHWVKYVLRYGCKKGIADCHGGVKVDAEVSNGRGGKVKITEKNVTQEKRRVAARRWKAIMAGTVQAGGGHGGNPIAAELVKVALNRAKMGPTKFEKEYGKGADGIRIFALKRVRDLFANKKIKFNAGNAGHTKVVTDYGWSMVKAAVKNVENRAVEDAVDLTGLITKE
jgi:hypothetical protein